MATNIEIRAEKAAAHEVEEKLGQNAIFEAKKASDDEHAQTLWQAIKANHKAIWWSALISMSIVMEGYDTILMGNFYAYPEFQRKYGRYYGGSVGWQVSTPWQTGLGMASTVGTIFGALLNGYLASRIGYRWVMIVSLGWLNVFIFMTFFAPSAAVLLIGQILCGLAWGVFATVGPAYASEVCPTVLRSYLTTYVNLCWAIGQLIAAGVLYGCLQINNEWSYRIPFAVQWAWPTPLMIVCFFAPESPWFLVRKDRLEQAKQSLKRLSGADKTQDEINAQLAMMVHTTRIEQDLTSGTNYWDCFKGSDLRRTEICCMALGGQVLSGSTFAYSPTYFFTSAGMNTDEAYKLNVGGTAIAFVGTCLSWFLVTYIGRRKIYVGGQSMLFTLLIIIGICSAAAPNSSGSLWAQAAFCICWLFIYSLTVGPIAYCIVSETSSVKLRPLTVVLGRNFYQIVNIISQVVEPYMMNPTAANAKGKTGFLWAGTCLLTLIWAYFRLPECKGRTYEELDLLFANGISARNFSSTQVDAYAVAAGVIEESTVAQDEKAQAQQIEDK